MVSLRNTLQVRFNGFDRRRSRLAFTLKLATIEVQPLYHLLKCINVIITNEKERLGSLKLVLAMVQVGAFVEQSSTRRRRR